MRPKRSEPRKTRNTRNAAEGREKRFVPFVPFVPFVFFVSFVVNPLVHPQRTGRSLFLPWAAGLRVQAVLAWWMPPVSAKKLPEDGEEALFWAKGALLLRKGGPLLRKGACP